MTLKRLITTGLFFGLPPDTETPVACGIKYRCALLMLLFWALTGYIVGAPDKNVGHIPFWITLLILTPYLIVPAFLLLKNRTAAQWRELMIVIYGGLSLLTLLQLTLPLTAPWGDLPAACQYGSIVLQSPSSAWEVTLPRFSCFWGLLIYVSLASDKVHPLLRLLTLLWWAALCLAPINTGLVGYMDLLVPLLILTIILPIMNVINKAGRTE